MREPDYRDSTNDSRARSGTPTMRRRGLLALAVAAVAVPPLGGAPSAGAPLRTQTEPVLIGARNRGRRTTRLVANLGGAALSVVNRGSPYGIALSAHAGPVGEDKLVRQSAAVFAYNDGEALGDVSPAGIKAFGHGHGVFAVSDTGIGVHGSSGAHGGDLRNAIGVQGSGPTAGRFLSGPGGVGVEVLGANIFSQADTRDIPAGNDSYDVVGITVRDGSFMLATVQGPPTDLFVVSVERVRGSYGDGFRVHFNRPVPEAGARLGFFVLN